MARLTGSKRRKKQSEIIAPRIKKAAERFAKSQEKTKTKTAKQNQSRGVAKGGTVFSGTAKTATKTKSKLRIAGAGDTPGAARAKAMAKKRIESGQTIAQAEAKRDATMKKGLKERHASWKKARKEGKLKEWEEKNKKKNKFSRAWD